MTKVVLKGLAARPLRTALSALAIVVGVAFVCAALTFTGAMRGAADSLSSAAYDGTDAVVTAKTAFEPGTDSWAQKPTLPAATLDEVRGTAGVDVAVGDITDTAQIMDGDGEPLGDGPYFGSGFDARTPGAERADPVPPRRGPLGHRSGRGRHRPGQRREGGLRRRRPHHRRHARRGAGVRGRRHRHLRRRQVDRHRHASRCSTSRPRRSCSARRARMTASSSRATWSRGRPARWSARPRPTTASTSRA